MQKPSSKLKPKTPKRSTTKNPVEEPEAEPVISHGLNRYHLGAEIGKGGFAVVFQAFNAHTGQTVAVKRFPLSAMAGKDSQISVELAEIELMHELDHPNIVKYFDTVKTKSFLYIVLEYMENGSLANVIKKFGSFSESLTAIYIMQVLRGLKYLHDQGVLHRDIKGANILTSKDGQVKLADFGVAMKMSGDGAQGGQAGGAEDNPDMAGSPYWMAPEIIEMSTPTSACDIWSVGCVVIELLTSKPPYYDMDPMSALFRIVSDDYPPFPEGISQALKDFLLQCFHKEPTMRSSAQKLLEHPWLGNSSSRQSLVQTSKMLKSRSIDAEGDVSMNQSTEVIQSAIRNYERNLNPIPEQDSPLDSARGSNHSSEKLSSILQEKGLLATPRKDSFLQIDTTASHAEGKAATENTSEHEKTAAVSHKVEFNPWPSVHLTGSTSLPGSAGSRSRSHSESDETPYNGSFAISGDSRGSSLNSATQLAIHAAAHKSQPLSPAVGMRRRGFGREPSIELDGDTKASPLTTKSVDAANTNASTSASTTARSGEQVSSARSLELSDTENLHSGQLVHASSAMSDGLLHGSNSGSFLQGMKVVSEDSFDDIANWDIDLSVSKDSSEEQLVKQTLGRNNISNIKHLSNTHSTSTKAVLKEPYMINLNSQSMSFIAKPEGGPVVGTGRHVPHAKLPNRAEQMAADLGDFDDFDDAPTVQPSKKVSVPMIKIPHLTMPGSGNSNNNNNNKSSTTPKMSIYSPNSHGGHNSSIDLLKYQEDADEADFDDFDGVADKFSERSSPPKSNSSGGPRLSPLPIHPSSNASTSGSQKNLLGLVGSAKFSKHSNSHGSIEEDFEDDFALDGEGFNAKIKAFKTGGHSSVLEIAEGLMSNRSSNQSVDPTDEFSPSSALSTARTPRQGGNLLVSHLRKRIQQVVTKDKDKESMDEDLDAFINYQYDEKDFKQNETKDLHFRRSREIVEVMNRIRLETKVKEVVDLSNQLLTIFSDIPEQRDHLITHHGVMPIVDMFDARSSSNFRSNGPHSSKNTKALYVLKVVNKIIEGSTKAKEQLSLVGIIPTVMSLFEGSFRHSIYQGHAGAPVTPTAIASQISSSTSTDSEAAALTPGINIGDPRPPLAPHIFMREEVDPLTLEAARFIHQICSTSSLTLQMLIGAGGLSVLTSMVSLGATFTPQVVTVAGITIATISTGPVSLVPSAQRNTGGNISGTASPATEARVAATRGIASMTTNYSCDFDAVPVTDAQLADDSLFATHPSSRQPSGVMPETDDAQTRMTIFHMGIDCITEVFAMKASRSRDFCRLFAKLGLLQPLSLSFQNVIAMFRARQVNITNTVISAVNAETASLSSAGLSPRDSFKGPIVNHRRDTSGSTLASPRHYRDNSGSTSLGSSFYIHSQHQEAEESAECRYAYRIATLFVTFSRSDAIVAETMVKAEHCVLHVMLAVLQAPELRTSPGRTTPSVGSGKNDVPLSTASLSAHNASSPSMYRRTLASLLPTYVEIVDLLLKCLKNLSMEPSALGDLEAAGTLDTLVPLLSGPINDRCKNHIFPCIFNMCRVNKRRQERVAALGLVPHLKKVITDGTPLRQFALPILFDLAHTSNSTRTELSKWNCLPFFLDLLKENYWQAFALNSIAVWLSNDSTNVAVLLVETVHLTKLIDFFKLAHAQTIHTLHRPLLDMMFKSPELCQALGLSSVFTSVLIKRLKSTDEAIVLRSLLKMLQLMHESHHAQKEWVVDNNLVALVEEFAKSERKVLVRQLAKKLLLDFKETSYWTDKADQP